MPTAQVKTAAPSEMTALARRAAEAAPLMARLGRQKKDSFLLGLARRIEDRAERLKAANAKDVERSVKEGRPAAFIERLTLSDKVVAAMVQGLREIAALDDPVGLVEGMTLRPNGLKVGRVRIPLGVIGFIYESRPNVTVDAAALCLKAGNAVILKGGSEALDSNLALGRLIAESLEEQGLPQAAAQVVPTKDRAAVAELLKLSDHIDLVIPRGGEGLVRLVAETARMPVLKHYKGVCHLYVDQGCDPAMAVALTHNGKTQRPGVCNALETLLVHRAEAGTFLPQIGTELTKAGVELRCCPASLPFVPAGRPAAEKTGRPNTWT